MRTAALAAASLVLASAATAVAQPDPKRKIAVLEFRSGSAELSGIGERCATQLSRLTSLDVLDQKQARASYGGDLDGALVKCQGDAACVAQIGVKLGVDELLLVGVAEFGDVILTLQRHLGLQQVRAGIGRIGFVRKGYISCDGRQ